LVDSKEEETLSAVEKVFVRKVEVLREELLLCGKLMFFVKSFFCAESWYSS